MPRKLAGVFAAAATPLKTDFSIDEEKLVAHCRWLLDEGGCDGVNLLGTTGEATSFSVAQRLSAMRAVAEAGLPLNRFMVGTGAAAMEDAVTLTKAARELGFAGALLLPPFYYKGIGEDALEAYVAIVIERACGGGGDFGLYLYHIPQFSGVPWPVPLVARLTARFEARLAGIKDSSGDLEHARTLAASVPSIAVFPGAESVLAEAPDVGFAGCISATTNVSGRFAARGWAMRGTEEGARLLEKGATIRNAIAGFPLISAVKWTIAEMQGDDGWRRVHPPLSGLTDAEWRSLRAKLDEYRLFDRSGARALA
jgi:4-hydroxy-tetrahydrodipicolinate synthase